MTYHKENAYNIKKYFQDCPNEDLVNSTILENKILLDLGLNNEILSQQPTELSEYYGKGLNLRIWQYPNQFSKYLNFISQHANKINSYLEIGSRFGGTFICHTEFLHKLNENFNKSVSVDIIDADSLLKEYIEITPTTEHKKINSLSTEFVEYTKNNFFDLVFIDGDHEYKAVKNDAEITKENSNIQVFHDITNISVKDVGIYWSEVKESYKSTHDFFEFTDQYSSVQGSYLGIGVAVRKEWIYL
jgi:hypothetical protein